MKRSMAPGRGRRGPAAVVLLSSAVLLGAAGASCSGSPTEPAGREVLLGGLFSLTGDWSTLGRNAAVAMQLAVDDVNEYLAGNAADLRFVVAVEDTRLDPAVALERAAALRARGAQLLIGPQSSAEVEALKPFVDASGLLLVSPSSTAGSLAIAGDNVFRFTPSDSLEGVAITTLMWEEGIRVVIPVWRQDSGNAGLERATRASFAALGGTVLTGVPYGTGETEFDAVVAALEAQLDQALLQHAPEGVAIYLAAFDEAVRLFRRAGARPTLGTVRWYGSDGVAQSEVLLEDPQAVEFAMRTGYPNPLFGRDEGAREIWEPLIERITARTGLVPDAFALAVYDAVWVVARGYVASGATTDIERLKHAFVTAAVTHYGATGWTVLNEAGDRRHGDFDYWAVHSVNGAPRWTRVGQYLSRTSSLVR
jgi:branched-chain amino acid transport system substrate-binding protein